MSRRIVDLFHEIDEDGNASLDENEVLEMFKLRFGVQLNQTEVRPRGFSCIGPPSSCFVPGI